MGGNSNIIGKESRFNFFFCLRVVLLTPANIFKYETFSKSYVIFFNKVYLLNMIKILISIKIVQHVMTDIYPNLNTMMRSNSTIIWSLWIRPILSDSNKCNLVLKRTRKKKIRWSSKKFCYRNKKGPSKNFCWNGSPGIFFDRLTKNNCWISKSVFRHLNKIFENPH